VVYMASTKREPLTGIQGQSPQWDPGAKPPVRGVGKQSPPEAGGILISDVKNKIETEKVNLKKKSNGKKREPELNDA